MGELKVILIVLIITAVVIQILLYKIKDNSKAENLIFYMNILFGLILMFMAYSSQPNNYIVQKILVAVWGLLAALSVILKFKASESTTIGKVMITIAIVGSFVQLLV